MRQDDGFVRTRVAEIHAYPWMRLWLLQRPEGLSPPVNVCRFAGAVVVLGDAGVYGAIVMAPDAGRAGAMLIDHGSDRGCERFYRHARLFETLQQALVWADASESDWLARGWRRAGH